MTNHPRRNKSRLASFGARMRTIDRRKAVEFPPSTQDPRIWQFRRSADGGIERRVLTGDGREMRDGSPWLALTEQEIVAMVAQGGRYHPILDPLGLRVEAAARG